MLSLYIVHNPHVTHTHEDSDPLSHVGEPKPDQEGGKKEDLELLLDTTNPHYSRPEEEVIYIPSKLEPNNKKEEEACTKLNPILGQGPIHDNLIKIKDRIMSSGILELRDLHAF
ncbi:hypothetical protein L1987_42605 [Smallanthus sonchifolius]|uniref:Uncharacterized protein n=1 Tax=Smallanthus sonchifolius TaxID=185202 RepID=A0ACB9GKJ8_9ASTR|nr:hypothetical protein L1987_42605 [Smallanthus sonchifolius]